MNQDTENNRPGDESDPLVSASYRATATERTPPELDAAVLKKAEAAPNDTGLRRFTAFWFRPLAFVATLGLSLALLLELNRSPESQSIATPDIEFEHSKAQSKLADPPPAVIGVTSEDDRTDSPTNMSGPTRSKNPIVETGRLESAPAPATDPVGTVDTSADFAEMIEASSKQIQEQQRVAEFTTQGLEQTRPQEKEQVREVAAFRASAFMLRKRQEHVQMNKSLCLRHGGNAYRTSRKTAGTTRRKPNWSFSTRQIPTSKHRYSFPHNRPICAVNASTPSRRY